MLSPGFLAAAETSSIAATDGRAGASGCCGVPGSVGGGVSGTPWNNGNAAGATCDGGPVCASGWRSVAVPFRVAAVAERPTAGGTGPVTTEGSGRGSGNAWDSGNTWDSGNVWGSGNAWGTAGVGVAGAGGKTVGWFATGCAVGTAG